MKIGFNMWMAIVPLSVVLAWIFGWETVIPSKKAAARYRIGRRNALDFLDLYAVFTFVVTTVMVMVQSGDSLVQLVDDNAGEIGQGSAASCFGAVLIAVCFAAVVAGVARIASDIALKAHRRLLQDKFHHEPTDFWARVMDSAMKGLRNIVKWLILLPFRVIATFVDAVCFLGVIVRCQEIGQARRINRQNRADRQATRKQFLAALRRFVRRGFAKRESYKKWEEEEPMRAEILREKYQRAKAAREAAEAQSSETNSAIQYVEKLISEGRSFEIRDLDAELEVEEETTIVGEQVEDNAEVIDFEAYRAAR